MAKLVEEEFAREIQAGGRYPVVTEAAPDVLRVRAGIVNLYINAPDTGPGRSRTIVSSAGEMTLIAELTDSASGQVLARVADRREATNTRMQLTNNMVNESEARLDRGRLGEDAAQGAGQRARAGREVELDRFRRSSRSRRMAEGPGRDADSSPGRSTPCLPNAPKDGRRR